MAQAESDYPIQFSVEYPDRNLNRLTTFFRIFTVIPIAIVLFAVSGGSSFSRARGRTRGRRHSATPAVSRTG